MAFGIPSSSLCSKQFWVLSGAKKTSPDEAGKLNAFDRDRSHRHPNRRRPASRDLRRLLIENSERLQSERHEWIAMIDFAWGSLERWRRVRDWALAMMLPER